jgi:hypothetical protein
MNNTNTGGPAYPAPVTKPLENYYPGISMRDYFAAKAIVQCIEVRSTHTRAGEEAYSLARAAEEAYAVADAMLKAREA